MNRRRFFRRFLGSAAGLAAASAAGPAIAGAVKKAMPVKKLPSEMSAEELADYWGEDPDAIAKMDAFLDRELAKADPAETQAFLDRCERDFKSADKFLSRRINNSGKTPPASQKPAANLKGN